MTHRYFMIAAGAHFGLSLAGFFLVNAGAVGVLDAGGADSGLGLTLARVVVDYGLLQPLGHWLLDAAAPSWWTWSGLIATAGIVATNSLGVVTVIWLLVSRARRA